MCYWFENWFDENYLKLYQHRNTHDAKQHVKLILKTLKLSKDKKILDIACGEGRHCILFQEAGYRIKGIDLSETLIRRGKEKYPSLDIEIGDMRNIGKIDGKYDLIVSLFTSFGYFDDDKENEQIIFSITEVINNGGWFWLDYLNPEFVYNNLIPTTETAFPGEILVREQRYIEKGMVVKDIQFINPEGIKHYQERVKLYKREDLEGMLLANRIIPIGSFGNYSGIEWEPCSARTIIYGRKEFD